MKQIKSLVYLILGALLCVSCSNDTETTPEYASNDIIEEGEIYCTSLKVGGREVVYKEEKILNYGDENTPVLFSTIILDHVKDDMYKNYFFSLNQDEIRDFIVIWAKFRGHDISTKEGKVMAALDMKHYINIRKIDMALLYKIVKNTTIEQTMQKIGHFEAKTAESRNINLMLYDMYRGEESGIYTKGTASNICSVVKDVVEIANVWIDFAIASQPVIESPDNSIRMLNIKDTNYLNYSDGTYFESEDVVLEYHEKNYKKFAEIAYFVSGLINSKHSQFGGEYIKDCHVRSTWVNVKGNNWLVKGGTSFANTAPGNKGTIDEPIIALGGCVNVEYGHKMEPKYSYEHFDLNSSTGYIRIPSPIL